MRWQRIAGVVIFVLCLCDVAIAGKGVWQGGFRLGFMYPYTELVDKMGGNGYGFVRWGFHRLWAVEVGGGYGRFGGTDYSTDFAMGETKLVWQAPAMGWLHPVVFFGGGVGKHSIHTLPTLFTNDSDTAGWVMTVPVGVGFQVPLNDKMRLELVQGYTYTYRDDLNGAILQKGNDTFFNWTIGLTFGNFWEGGKKEERREKNVVGRTPPVPVMAPDSPDDDGDGLTDKEELEFYHTNPDVADSDGDGLTDYDEVRKYFTNPNAVDSDGDGLLDDEEVVVYKTSPHISDTDKDGLPDGLEVVKYRTDPTVADTDGDGIKDGDEVFKGTDPLKAQ